LKTFNYFTLSNSVKIPAIGFGTWALPNGEDCCQTVSFALKNGYRHIDTAYIYENEESVGRAVRDSGIERSEIFVTSKLPDKIKIYKEALESFNKTMENLGLDYIDLYLIHAPNPWDKQGEDLTKENIIVWKAMEEIYKSGRCRSIGVSNFRVSDLAAIIDNCSIKPMVNQIRFFIGNTQEEITKFCQKNNILVEGYSPLAKGSILNNNIIAAIAEKYNKTVSQICIRYILQRGVVPLPKSAHPKYILENIDLDFEILDDDMKFLDSLKNTVSSIHGPKKNIRFLKSLKNSVRFILGPKKYYRLKYKIGSKLIQKK
jgi:diketogulonate reductase-like aldo/keto reductase